jgi:hypothetical protein
MPIPAWSDHWLFLCLFPWQGERACHSMCAADGPGMRQQKPFHLDGLSGNFGANNGISPTAREICIAAARNLNTIAK